MIGIILVHNHYSKEHLTEVMEEMKTLGTPTIKAVYLPEYDAYVALEGCHRIRAAKALELVPEIIEFDYDEVCNLSLKDPMLGLDLDNDETVEWLIDGCTRRTVITFEEEN